MLKIVHVITGLEQGGAEGMLEKLILAARTASPEVTHSVISLRGLGVIGPRLRAAGVPVRALGMTNAWRAFLAWPRLVACLRSEAGGEGVVQTWMYHADLLGGLAARAAERPVVWNLRQTGLALHDIGRVTRSVARLCAMLSNRIPARIVCNARAAIAVHERIGYAAPRFVVIPNGFDTTVFARRDTEARALRRAWGIPDDELVIGMVARLDPQKDHTNFIAAARHVGQALGTARFVLVGRGIRGSVPLRDTIADSGLAERFVLEDERSDMPAVMSALDIFCLSSRAEGFPNVLGEAMACETPCVATDAGETRTLLGDDSLVAPIENASALSECVLRIARLSPGARRALGAEQRRRIVTHFDIHSVWQRYRDLYQTL